MRWAKTEVIFRIGTKNCSRSTLLNEETSRVPKFCNTVLLMPKMFWQNAVLLQSDLYIITTLYGAITTLYGAITTLYGVIIT